jgi:mannose-6-phosphate isomerase
MLNGAESQMTQSPLAAAAQQRDRLKNWLLQQAFPLWWNQGYDHGRGGFHEKLDQQGQPVEANRRARVQARQVYSYAVAGRLGWDGPVQTAVAQGLTLFLDRFQRPDGLVRGAVSPDGAPVDENVALYDQAFVLFSMAQAARALKDVPGYEAKALAVLDSMRTLLPHPVAGFVEPAGKHRQQSNPHMHLFEACLAWEELTGNGVWTDLADTIAGMALRWFIDGKTGALREFFAADWSPADGVDGRIVEPGHQFEWAWLLLRWGTLRKRNDAVEAGLRLIAIGEGSGVDKARNVAFNSLLDDFSSHDTAARLWPQTERIKAGCLAGLLTGKADYWQIAADGAAGLWAYLQTPVAGLWYDRMQPDGSLIDEAAPASSFYHIICAIVELDQALQKAGV